MASKWPQDGPKTAQDRPKTAQDGLMTAQDGPKTVQEEPKTPCNISDMLSHLLLRCLHLHIPTCIHRKKIRDRSVCKPLSKQHGLLPVSLLSSVLFFTSGIMSNEVRSHVRNSFSVKLVLIYIVAAASQGAGNLVSRSI